MEQIHWLSKLFMIFLKPESQQIKILKLLHQIFAKLSSLKVSLQKSQMLITSSHLYQVQQLVQIMRYKAMEFSLEYLSLSLSDKPLTTRDY
jgi:VanZ family protein